MNLIVDLCTYKLGMVVRYAYYLLTFKKKSFSDLTDKEEKTHNYIAGIITLIILVLISLNAIPNNELRYFIKSVFRHL